MEAALRYAIALTGIIGSGKSTLVSFLSLYGYESVCADTIAREILSQNEAQVIAHFGEAITDSSGAIDRKKLGALVFGSKSKREELQEMLHPLIQAEILARAWQLEEKRVWYFLDIPLFFEVGGKDAFPVARSLVVYTPARQAIERIMKRDSLTREEAQARLDSQIGIEEKCRLADDVIGNDGTLRALQQRVEAYLHSLPTHKG